MTARSDPPPGALVAAGPVPPGERLPLLDVLRGIALVGVLAANLPLHHAGPQLAAQPAPTAAEELTVRAIGALATGKFFVLFSLLFGLGLVLQDSRARARGEDVRRRYRRRCAGLVVLGLLHLVLLFDGDILLTYGLLGLALPLFLGRSPRTLLAWTVGLVAVGALATAALAGLLVALGGVPTTDGVVDLAYGESAALRAGALATLLPLLPFVGPAVLGMFVLGVAVARGDWLRREEVLRRLRGPVFLLGLALAVPGGWVAGAVPLNATAFWPQVLATLAVAVGGPLVALGTVGWTSWWLARRPGSGLAAAFGRVGRLSLSCYLAQSLLLQPLLASWGLGLASRLPLWGSLLVALLVYVAIAAAATLWLRRYRFGPAEWLLRSWTYRAWQPLGAEPRR